MLTSTQVADAMKAAQTSERLSPEALGQLQSRKLRELVQFAASHSQFYARHYQSIDLDRLELTDLPPVDKETIQSHFEEVVTDPRLRLPGIKQFSEEATEDSPWYLGEFAVLLTSGTTGQRGYYVWDAQTLADAAAVGYRQSNRPASGSAPAGPQRIAAVAQVDPCDATWLLLSMIPASVGEKCLIDIRQEFSAVCRQLNEFQPTLLASYPYLLWLLGEAAQDGRLRIQPTRITSSADVLTESDRSAIRSAFHVEPFNYYCSTEFPYLAWECDAHEGLHVNMDYFLLESVDAAGRPVPPGRLGDKVFVTNLSNRAMPLIRYEMSDQVEFAAQPCRCGCPLPRIRTVAGRVEHLLVLPGRDGRRVRVVEEYVDDFVGRLGAVARYQVIQEAPSQLTVNVVTRGNVAWDEARTAVDDALQRCFRKYGVDGERVRVNLRSVESLQPVQPGSRKVCRFWNRCR